MTYGDLLKELETLTPEQLDMDVTVYDYMNEEHYPIDLVSYTTNSDQLDENHPVLNIAK